MPLSMKIYMVGGAVRDQILGSVPKDRDWVIVGADEYDIKFLESQGYSLVGADFPVYLHPKTNEEYALARRERKVGNGYNGFKMETRPGNLNSELMKKFIDMGFKKDKDYPINVLLKAFRRINR